MMNSIHRKITFTFLLFLYWSSKLLIVSSSSFFLTLYAYTHDSKSISAFVPTSVELNIPFSITVETVNTAGNIAISGTNIENHGQLGFTASKTLNNGVFNEKRMIQYQLMATSLGTTTITVMVGNEKKHYVIEVVTKNKSQRKSSTIRKQKNKYNNYSESVKVKNILTKNQLYINEISELTTIIRTAVTVRNPSLTKRFNESCYKLIPIKKFNSKSGETMIDGVNYYQTIIMKHLIYGHKEGDCIIEDIAFKVAVTPNRSSGFILNNEVIEVRTKPITLKIIDYPIKDRKGITRPNNFNYQYGDYSLNYNLSDNTLVPSVPLILTVSISGVGNFYTLGEPKLLNISPFLTVSQQQIIDSYQVNNEKVRGKKIFKYYLTYQDNVDTPKSNDERITLPHLSLEYFSSRRNQYQREVKKLPSLYLNHSTINDTQTYLQKKISSTDLNNTPNQLGIITNLNTLTSQHSSLVNNVVGASGIVFWYHFAGIATMALSILGVGIASSFWLGFGFVGNLKTIESFQKSKSNKIINAIKITTLKNWLGRLGSLYSSRKQPTQINYSSSEVLAYLERIRMVVSERANLNLSPKVFIKKTISMLMKLPLNVEVNDTDYYKEYWHTLNIALATTLRIALQVGGNQPLMKELKNLSEQKNYVARNSNTKIISDKKDTTNTIESSFHGWLNLAIYKLQLYEEKYYNFNNLYHPPQEQLHTNTSKNFQQPIPNKALGEIHNECSELVALMSTISRSL